MYSIAISQIWKEFFSLFPKIFKFYFIFYQRTLHETDKGGIFVNQLSEQREGEPAERHAVERGARTGEEHGVESRAPGSGAQPEQEQAREHDERIQDVQRRSADCAQPCARRAERVEHQPERIAQRDREHREHDLIRDGRPHPKSLAQKPSPRCGASA